MNDCSLRLLCPDDGDRSNYVNRPISEIPAISRYYEGVINQGESCIGAELTMELGGDIHHYMLDVQPVLRPERATSSA
ncbi:hypothetical protein [Paenibacillus ihbetae]|uniref:hypothetical protein n=1 Tax=Paenibacillus ihbetae TaxID=1870820 RepID=UPI001CB8DFE0|nr:hypothetical protein [Paenibacillus ihbetae]